MLLVAMLALVLVAAAPVIAQVGNEFDDQELESGEIGTETDLAIDGNNNNQCAGLLQFGNTGNFGNEQGTSQYDQGEFEQEFEGPETEFGPENGTACEQAVQQPAVASEGEKAAPKKEKKAEVKPENKEEKKELPKSGGNGSVSLLALG